MIQTARNGRPTKWHKAQTWKSNDAFWITACGMAVFKVSATVRAEDHEGMCARCRESLQGDESAKVVASENENRRTVSARRGDATEKE